MQLLWLKNLFMRHLELIKTESLGKDSPIGSSPIASTMSSIISSVKSWYVVVNEPFSLKQQWYFSEEIVMLQENFGNFFSVQ